MALEIEARFADRMASNRLRRTVLGEPITIHPTIIAAEATIVQNTANSVADRTFILFHPFASRLERK